MRPRLFETLGCLALIALLCVISITVSANAASAQVTRQGTVTMQGPSVHGGAAKGDGKVLTNTGYYIASAIDGSLTLSRLNLLNIPDGTTLVVTVEYLDPKLAPVVIGTIKVSGGGGSLPPPTHPVSVSTASKINSMSLRRVNGAVIMSGIIKGF